MRDFIERMGLDPDDFTWQALGLCVGADPEVWHSRAEKDEAFEKVAKDICAVCPVRIFCEEQAIRNKETGIWGGKTFVNGKVQDHD